MDISLDINKALESLAKAFNVTVDYLYPVLVTQAKIKAYTSISMYAVALVIFIICFIFFMKNLKKVRTTPSDLNVALTVATGIICFFIGFITVLTLPEKLEAILTALYNPDYFMVREVLDVISGGKD